MSHLPTFIYLKLKSLALRHRSSSFRSLIIEFSFLKIVRGFSSCFNSDYIRCIYVHNELIIDVF